MSWSQLTDPVFHEIVDPHFPGLDLDRDFITPLWINACAALENEIEMITNDGEEGYVLDDVKQRLVKGRIAKAIDALFYDETEIPVVPKEAT